MSLNKPLISIVVPVKNNYGTLEHTLHTLLNQSYFPMEIVVSNNSMQADVHDLVIRLGDKRLKYVSPCNSKSFSDDWEFALSAADGDYITYIGDDDAMLPESIVFAMELISETGTQALVWNKLNYQWPDHLNLEVANSIQGKFSNKLYNFNSHVALDMIRKCAIGYNKLPCIYNSIVSKDLIDAIKNKSKSKKFFSGVIPDVYSGIAVATALDSYIYADFPLSINGASAKSSGVIQGLKELSPEQKLHVKDVISSGEHYDKRIGEFSSSIASIVLGEYLIARNQLDASSLKSPSWISYILYLLYESRSSQKYYEIVAAAKHTASCVGVRWLIPWSLFSGVVKVSPLSTNFTGYIKIPKKFVDNVHDVSKLMEYAIPVNFNYEKVTLPTQIRVVFIEFIRKLIGVYRIYKLCQHKKLRKIINE